MTEILAGLALGAAASGHCAAMCGPLMLAWRQQSGVGHAWVGVSVYHAARVATYAIGGALAGLAGQAVSAGGFAQGLSIAAGVSLILMAVRRAGFWLPAAGGSGTGAMLGRVLSGLRGRWGRHPVGAAAVSGVLNALLPCGLLYAAIAAAAAAADPGRSALAMVAYGVGTTPVLIGIWWSAARLSGVNRRRLAFVSPAVLAVTGVLLIGRGLDGGQAHSHSSSPAVTTSTAEPHHSH